MKKIPWSIKDIAKIKSHLLGDLKSETPMTVTSNVNEETLVVTIPEHNMTMLIIKTPSQFRIELKREISIIASYTSFLHFDKDLDAIKSAMTMLVVQAECGGFKEVV